MSSSIPPQGKNQPCIPSSGLSKPPATGSVELPDGRIGYLLSGAVVADLSAWNFDWQQTKEKDGHKMRPGHDYGTYPSSFLMELRRGPTITIDCGDLPDVPKWLVDELEAIKVRLDREIAERHTKNNP